MGKNFLIKNYILIFKMVQDEDYENHLKYMKFSEKKFYTPRGMGHRKLVNEHFLFILVYELLIKYEEVFTRIKI